MNALLVSSSTAPQENRHIETHASHIILTKDFAYKIKKNVSYNFLDYSSLELRRKACAKELRLNRRIAPGLYLAVVPITLENRTIRFCGQGEVIEWAVKMRRFDDDAQLDSLALHHGLSDKVVRDLADVVSDFHKQAPAAPKYGGFKGTEATLTDLISNIKKGTPSPLSGPDVATWIDLINTSAERVKARLNARQRRGFVRECHGDLHLGNICVFQDRPTPFDAIEFNDSFRCIDIAYDVSFLLMDLVHRGLDQEANAFLSRYEENTRDFSGLSILPLFMSMRAAIRAMVGGLPEAGQSQREEAPVFLEYALKFLQPRPSPKLIAVGGLSGTGKSTLARRLSATLSEPTDCIVIRSDSIRKRLAGVQAETRLSADHYTPANSERVYQRLCKDAFHAVKAGVSVVVDATFLSASEQDHIESFAKRTGVEFVGLWLEAPSEVLEERIRSRINDASDATVEILRRQLSKYAPPSRWHLIDASGSPEKTLALCKSELSVKSK